MALNILPGVGLSMLEDLWTDTQVAVRNSDLLSGFPGDVGMRIWYHYWRDGVRWSIGDAVKVRLEIWGTVRKGIGKCLGTSWLPGICMHFLVRSFFCNTKEQGEWCLVDWEIKVSTGFE